MTTGVEIDVADGLATIHFPDLTTRGEFLTELLGAVGPDNVRKVTRPRVGYVVPEAALRAAGALDDAVVEPPSATDDGTGSGTLTPTTPDGQSSSPQGTPGDDSGTPPAGPNADDGKPDMDWSRDALNEYAAEHGVEAPEKLPNKPTVLAAIRDAAEKAAAADRENTAQGALPADHLGTTVNDPSGDSPLPTGDFAPADDPQVPSDSE